MPDYSNGKIYKLVNDSTNRIYIGSTTIPLKQRLSNHKSSNKRYRNGKGQYLSACDLFDDGEVTIELMEECPCDNRRALTVRERHHLDKNRSVCVNHNTPSRTIAEYNENNKDAIRSYHRKYYTAHRPKLCKKSNEYYHGNLLVNRAKMKSRARHRRSVFGQLCYLVDSLA